MLLRRLAPFAAIAGTLLPVLSPASAAPHTYTIVIDQMRYAPAPAGLRKGDLILWVNHDFLRHTATANDHSFDVDLPAGAAKKTLLSKAGSIAFSCRFHPGMKGVLQVQ